MTRSKPVVVEMFSGAGLFGSAFVAEGYELIWSVELDPMAAETHRANLQSEVEVGDIRAISPDGDCDVLIAGPPCQGFSTLNRRKNDPRNALSLEVVRWCDALNPSVVVVENVAAYTGSTEYASLRRRLRSRGFDVETFVLDAFDFGVPQRRMRCFVVAHRACLGEIKPVTRRLVRSVKAAWRGLPDQPDEHRHHVAPAPSPTALARFRVIPEGGDRRHVLRKRPDLAPPSWWRVQGSATDAWGRMSWSAPSNTIRTAFQNASKGRYIHPSQNRVISLREGARLQSVPDRWTFCGTPTHIARQIGNCVPPLLGRAIARAVRPAC